jgi:hypothetical protein
MHIYFHPVTIAPGFFKVMQPVHRVGRACCIHTNEIHLVITAIFESYKNDVIKYSRIITAAFSKRWFQKRIVQKCALLHNAACIMHKWPGLLRADLNVGHLEIPEGHVPRLLLNQDSMTDNTLLERPSTWGKVGIKRLQYTLERFKMSRRGFHFATFDISNKSHHNFVQKNTHADVLTEQFYNYILLFVVFWLIFLLTIY